MLIQQTVVSETTQETGGQRGLWQEPKEPQTQASGTQRPLRMSAASGKAARTDELHTGARKAGGVCAKTDLAITLTHHCWQTERRWGSLSPAPLCDPMDCTVHGILQARTLEWAAFPFSRGSPRPRNRTRVSCTAGGFFTNWAIRETPQMQKHSIKHKLNSILKKYIPWPTGIYPRYAKLVWYLEINYCNLSHQQAQKEKWYDPVSRCRKGFWQDPTPTMMRTICKSGVVRNILNLMKNVCS